MPHSQGSLLPRHTNQEIHILEAFGLGGALVSVLLGTVTFYWFIRMERVYRHRLIMLQIQCDMLKSIWYIIHAVLVLIRGRVQTSSAFCQVSGFFLSFSTEASDFAVLMIAIHAALYIFSPPKHSSEGGLYPHRRTIYVLWIGIPSLLASLAYLPPRGGYFTRGTYCALPIRPFWYRLALSWTPRYIILCAIVGIYISIYFHVRHKFKMVEMDLLERSSQRIGERAGPVREPRAGGLDGEDSRDSTDRAALPKLRCHGLVTDSESGSGSFEWIPTGMVLEPDSHWIESAGQFMSDTSDASDTWLLNEEASDDLGFGLWSGDENLPTVGRSASDSGVDGPADPQSVVGIMDALQESRISAQEAFQIAQRRSRDKLHRDRTPMAGTERLRKSHQNIRRQLRMLFVYPLVYLMIWVLPFSWHCLQYSDYYIDHPPSVLVCLVTLVLALQCAINCTVFASREKPWRFITCSNGSFLGSFAIWQCTRSKSISHVEQHHSDEVSPGYFHTHRRNRRQRPRSHHPAGKTRAVVVQETRDARDRRKLEVVEAARMKALRDHLALGRNKVGAVPSSPNNDGETTSSEARVGRRGQEERLGKKQLGRKQRRQHHRQQVRDP